MCGSFQEQDFKRARGKKVETIVGHYRLLEKGD